QKRDEVPKGTLSCPDRIMEVFYQLRHYEGSHLLLSVCGRKLIQQTLSNPQKITCIIFENLFGSYFLPHQSHSYGYAPSSGENLTSKILFKSDATDYFHITKNR
ncbi:MAG: hypothetical protein PUF38_04040, partial [Bacteroidales bacterium]|nr:hypothetical protein [Bacteroidales bacterium]